MKYLCLIDWETTNGKHWAERELLDQMEVLRSSGRIIAPSRWRSSTDTVAIRFRNGTATVSEGCCPESAPLASLCLIDARDLNDAIRIASRLLVAGSGCIELRPLAESDVMSVSPEFKLRSGTS